jgi:hypothetical protein
MTKTLTVCNKSGSFLGRGQFSKTRFCATAFFFNSVISEIGLGDLCHVNAEVHVCQTTKPQIMQTKVILNRCPFGIAVDAMRSYKCVILAPSKLTPNRLIR